MGETRRRFDRDFREGAVRLIRRGGQAPGVIFRGIPGSGPGAGIAVVFGLIAWWLYPARTELPAPSYTTLQLQSPFAVEAVNYAVYQGQATARIEISVLLSSGSPASPPPAGKTATLLVFPPLGIAFQRCPAHLCFHSPGGTYAWAEPLNFRQAVGPSLLPDLTGHGMYASFSLDVKARDFGVVSDGATAAAAVPKLIDIGPGSPNLLTHYKSGRPTFMTGRHSRQPSLPAPVPGGSSR